MSVLFSETKERENRFITALKISVPFTCVLIVFGIILFRNGEFKFDDVILFLILLICYVYYVIYQIYFGFQKTLIDPVTHVFVREEIEKILSNDLAKNRQINIVLLRIKNIIDINDRYGYKNGDEILYEYCKELSNFMAEQGFKDLPIGRFINGYFVFGVESKATNLSHILRMFEHKISSQTIKNVEIKSEFTMLPSSYDRNLNNIVNALFYKINHLDDEEHGEKAIDVEKVLIDVFSADVMEAIDSENFSFKYQRVADKNGVKSHINLIPKLDLRSGEKITKSRILDILLLNHYDIKYDISMMRQISRIIYFKDIDAKIFIEIMPQTLRNNEFRNEILKLIDNNLIDPKKIVFEFNEKLIYSEIKRFDEILIKFRELGFSFALSQFGGSNASFEYLKFLNVDFIVYDIEFNKNLNDEKIKNIFIGINEACAKSGVETVMRFIDKEEFQMQLYKMGIDYIQGFCVEKPNDISNLRRS
ncbi:EAL domain-containing protein [uncultured Campylobacter sp.]|uniref:EAL domain-containing protein n=1 Tax=uncultured Campylobacter sp. TaxID=218934 RepID=UPI0028EF9943|nr:EAL domain-containing protein [uncultured Campylobacter sp.]